MTLGAGTLLAFDTSGPVGSVAVTRAGSVLAGETLTMAREHASLLVPTIDRVLGAADVGRDDLTGIVVGEGPGSFTGVRVGAATAKGLTHAWGMPLVAVSSLAGAAMAVAGSEPVRCALFDARGERVYAGCWEISGDGVTERVAPFAGTVTELLDGRVPDGAIFVGDGAERHAARLGEAGHPVRTGSDATSIAEGLVRFLLRSPDCEPVAEPHGWEPSYLKASSAERLWTA